MDIEVISLIEDISNSLNGVLENSIYNKDIRKNKYCRIGGKNIKISVRKKEDLLIYKSKAKRTVILIKQINEINERLLLKFVANNSTVVITEDYSCQNKSLEYVKILVDLENSLRVECEAFLFFLVSNDIFKDLPWNKGENKIVIGRAKKEELVSRVVMSTLQGVNYLENSKVIEIELYGNDELSLKELSYIEDPLRDYLNYNKLRIIQRKNTYNNKYIYFMLICND